MRGATSPRSALPPCLFSAAKRKNFVRGVLSTDGSTLFFAPEEHTHEGTVRVLLRDVCCVHVVRSGKGGEFVVLTVAEGATPSKREVCLQPESSAAPKAAYALKDHIACLVSVASGKPMEEILGEDDEGSLLSRLMSRSSPRGSDSKDGGGGGSATESPRSSDSSKKGDSASPMSSPRSPRSGMPRYPSFGRKIGEKVGIAVSSPTSKPPVAVGWLWKHFPSQWKRKYFMLMESAQLVYYETEEMSRVKGHAGSGFIDLSFLKKAQTKGQIEFEGTALWTFELVLMTGRHWLLAADAPEGCIWWLKYLTSVGKPAASPRSSADESGVAERGSLQSEEPASVASEEEGEDVVLDRLGTTLACYEPGLAAEPSAHADNNNNSQEFVHSLKKQLGLVLSLDDEEFYNMEDLPVAEEDKRARSETSSEIQRMLSELDAKIFGSLDSSGVEAAVYATIEEHAAKSGGSDDSRIEAAVRLKGRLQTIRARKANPAAAAAASTLWDEAHLPPLPESAPSIHDHDAYREYVRLRRAHDRRKRKGGGGWARALTPQSSSENMPRAASPAAAAVVVGTPPPPMEAPMPPPRSSAKRQRKNSVGTPPMPSLTARASQELTGSGVRIPLKLPRSESPVPRTLSQEIGSPRAPPRADKLSRSPREVAPDGLGTSPPKAGRWSSASPRASASPPGTSVLSGSSPRMGAAPSGGSPRAGTSPRANASPRSDTSPRSNTSPRSPGRDVPNSPQETERLSPRRANTSPRAADGAKWIRPLSHSEGRVSLGSRPTSTNEDADPLEQSDSE